MVDGHDIIPDIRAAQSRMRTLAAQIRAGLRVGATGRPIRAVVNLGIGGSDLGPLLVCSALAPPPRARGSTGPQTQGVDVAFVANVDPEHLTRALAPLEPATTLFIVTSKTFTTQETLANAASAKAWLVAALGKGVDVNSHFVAVTGNAAAAQAFGTASADVLPLWDWVGGRYSLWSPAGLPIALKLGFERFEKLLAGAASVDAHFREEPLERNLPVLLGLVGWWNATQLRHPERVVVPYAQALFRLPAYLQQLVLESNGKRVGRDGGALPGPTSAGALGRGRHQRPARVLPVAASGHARGAGRVHRADHGHASAGEPADAARRECARPGAGPARRAQPGSDPRGTAGARAWPAADLDAAVAARVCPGNRASTMLLMPELSSYRLGQLLALYEHRTFVEAVLYGINPFDQFGVELGKTLAGPIVAALAPARGAARRDRCLDAGTRRACARAQRARAALIAVASAFTAAA